MHATRFFLKPTRNPRIAVFFFSNRSRGGPLKKPSTFRLFQPSLPSFHVSQTQRSLPEDGTGFDYSARVEALDIRADNMAPWLERRVADALAKSIERSQNKRRKKAKMARHRLPSWLPLEVSLEVELTEQ